jgi:hypothetical protein
MCGKMYFYFNYVFIKNLGSGKIRPEFRVCDSEWFKLIEECNESREWGIVCVKRRRAGMSWKEAADVIHDCMLNKHFHVGMNSKSDRDSEHLFDKVIFIYENLLPEFKAKIGRKNGMHIEFFRKSKNEDGSIIRKGNQSSIVVVPPTDSAYEGMMLTKWVCDEAGKIPNLPQLWSFTVECMMQEMERIGVPILFGTSGDISTNGGGLMHMWDKAEIYRLKRFFFAGWMGLAVDEFGNDQMEEAIRWIVYRREEVAKIDPKTYNDFIQKYPLTVSEAFSQAAGGLGDVVKVNAQKASLRENPPMMSLGDITRDINTGDVVFKPKRFGEVIIYEQPSPKYEYIAACDPADHDDVSDEASDMSIHIVRMPHGLEPAKIVLEYCCRPAKAADYYEKAAMCLVYYDNTKVLIENNRYRMIDYFKENGYFKLLEYSPPPIDGIYRVRARKLGIRMTADVKGYMENLIRDYIDDYCEYIPSIELLNEISDYGSRNTDRVISFGLALLLLRSKMKTAKEKTVNEKSKIPSFSWKMKNGRLMRITKR